MLQPTKNSLEEFYSLDKYTEFVVQWLKWHSSASVLFLGASSGTLWMWKIPSGETKTFIGDSSAKNSGGALTNGGQFHTYILSSYV